MQLNTIEYTLRSRILRAVRTDSQKLHFYNMNSALPIILLNQHFAYYSVHALLKYHSHRNKVYVNILYRFSSWLCFSLRSGILFLALCRLFRWRTLLFLLLFERLVSCVYSLFGCFKQFVLCFLLHFVVLSFAGLCTCAKQQFTTTYLFDPTAHDKKGD